MSLVAGVDSSTQSCTVELRDANGGRLRGRGSAPHPQTTPPISEQHPESWWNAFRIALAAACTDAEASPSSVVAISVAAQCHGLVAMDASDQVLRSAKLWNDTSSSEQAERMVRDLGVPGWVRAVGIKPTAALTITKLAWLRQNEPATFSQVRHVMLPHDYLTFRLTGARVTDRSDASGTGYFGLSGAWETTLLSRFVAEDVDWAHCLPTVLASHESAGKVRPNVCEELGLKGSVVVGAGGGDQHLGAVGLGLRVGEVAFSLGTSGVVLTPTVDPVVDESGWIDSVADATGGFLPLVCTLNATKVTDTFARLLGVGVNELGQMALKADPSRTPPALLAYLDGERSPARPDSRGILAGITTETTREDLAYSAFQGVISGLARGHAALTLASGPLDGDVVVAGGGARSKAYLQLIADTLGTEVTTREAPDATSRGACIQAAAVLSGDSVANVRDEWPLATIDRVAPRAGFQPGVSPAYLLESELDDRRQASAKH